MRWALAFYVLTVPLAATSLGDDVKLVLWNGEELFDVAAVDARQADIARMATELRPDILLIDEVCSLAVTDRVREIVEGAIAAPPGSYTAYCSDFVQNDATGRNAFEVGIISRIKADAVVELDPTPDNKLYDRDGEPEEMPLDVTPLLKQGLRRAGSERGVLWARFDALQLTVCVTHLKSSLGLSGLADAQNAKKREFVAGAMALSVLNDKQLFPGYTYAVIGDLNVGATDAGKNGADLDVDAFDGSGDGYDDTHYLLREVAGMTCLTAGIGETYDSDEFPGTGPIDNIYAAGARVAEFRNVAKSAETYGSDHFAVSAVYRVP